MSIKYEYKYFRQVKQNMNLIVSYLKDYRFDELKHPIERSIFRSDKI